MALNPIVFTENVLKSFLRYQLTAYPFADPGLHAQMRNLLSLDETRRSPLFKGPYISLSRPFREGKPINELVSEGLLHPHLQQRIPAEITHLYSHQEQALRAIHGGKTTLISTGTGSGKTECFLYPIISRCLSLRDEQAPAGISAVIVYPMNALAEDQLMRLRSLLAGTGISFGMYVGKTPEKEVEVTGIRLPAGASRADYNARLKRAEERGSGETVHPAEEICSREVMRTGGRQPRILLTNVKQLELLLTRGQDVELFNAARLDYLIFDEAHTFTGAIGAETACLIRRLGAFCTLGAGHTVYVATSATIVDQQEPDAARNFAVRFFGVPAGSVITIGEGYEEETWPATRALPPAPGGDTATILDHCVRSVEEDAATDSEVRAAYRSLSGRDLEPGNWAESLYSALSRNELVYQLTRELATPKALDELPATLEKSLSRPVTEAEILAWLTLSTAARREGRPLLRPVVHGFIRGISGAVVTFPEERQGPRLWLAAEDEIAKQSNGENHAHFPVTTCTTCGQHYYSAFLKDFEFTGKTPGGGGAGPEGSCWPPLEKTHGGKRVIFTDKLISDSDDDTGHSERTFPLHVCRGCGTAHPETVLRCRSCGNAGETIELFAIREKKKNPGFLSSCLSCKSNGRTIGSLYREPARPVRATNVADVHVLAQDMVHHSERPRLLVFCDNRQDAAFQAGWMKDHARRFRLRALMAEGIRKAPVCSIGDLTAYLDNRMEQDQALSRALIPEVWQVARREGSGGGHLRERRKFLRFQVLREITLSSRQVLGLEPWGRMKVDYEGLDVSLSWIQSQANTLKLPADELREGIAGLLDYLRRNRILYDPEHEIFSRYWMDGDREIQQGYLPDFLSPKATKLYRGATEKSELVTQWLSGSGNTSIWQVAKKWGAENIPELLESLFSLLVDRKLLIPMRLKGSKGRPLPDVSEVYQVNSDLLRLYPNHGFRRCKSCRRATTRRLPHDRCPAWRCNGTLEFVSEDPDNYDLQLLDNTYSMLRPEEHTAMVPIEERERLENLFKGKSEALNCFVCTPTLELGIDIGRLDTVLMRNVPPLAANYWQRVGRAGRRHRMAVDITYCRPVSHDRAYFADPVKLLAGRIDPPAFNLRNGVMVAKHVNATIITRLYQYAREMKRSENGRANIQEVLHLSLPRRISSYLFEDGNLRRDEFDLAELQKLVEDNSADIDEHIERVFHQGWPDADLDVIDPETLRRHRATFVENLASVIRRLRRRLNWAMEQIIRLNARREQKGTLDSMDETLFRRCDNLVKRFKGTHGRKRREAEGHDDFNTFSVLAAEGFLPGYGLETGSVTGWAEIPFWKNGAMDFVLPRNPATALREYVPGNLIYANGHRFVARRFHRDIDEDSIEMPFYEVSTSRQAVRKTDPGANSTLEGQTIQAMAICDTDLIHTSHISDEEELRFQLGVAIYGIELDQHEGGKSFRWGSQHLQLRRSVRLRLVNAGASTAIQGGQELGYPVCTVCGQSVSPLSSERQREQFRESHLERCNRKPEAIGFYANIVADVLSLPACQDATTAYSVLEALRVAATRVLDMNMEDLQALVIGHVDRDEVDAFLWDPMSGGSGLLERLLERFDTVVQAALEVADHCPAVCSSSCIDCLQSFRNAYYHQFLDRRLVSERIADWGSSLSFDHDIPHRNPSITPEEHAVPVNDAETKLLHLLLAAGFSEGDRNEQIRLDRVLGTTTPDVLYRAEHHEQDEGVCIYLDGLNRRLHGNPETAERDRNIRSWLRNNGYEVIEISVNQLDDEEAMVRHFRRLASYLERPDLRDKVRNDRSWFNS